ncbi:MAG TPA: O-antigen polysaccharide polymerase Wzy [Polyangia bacterium]|jgi:hypothetical protein
MNDYGQALLIDVVTVLCCTGLLVRFGDLRLSHPATPYLIFHVHTVTIRLAGLLNGAQELYSNSPNMFEPVLPPEIERAALYADIAFWLVTLVWVFYKASPNKSSMKEGMKLDPRILRPMLFITFAIGVIGLRVAARLPGIELYDSSATEWSTSSYIIILPTWFGLAVLGYAYYYGGGLWTGIALSAYLLLMSVQGGMRFRVIIGLLLAVQVWVERRDRRWPSKSIVILLAGAALLFFPMKRVGIMVIDGESMSDISAEMSDSATEVSQGSAPDDLFLDEFASALTLLDRRGEMYMGSIFLPLLTLPVPRAFWPDKPILAGYLQDISTSNRPMATSGMISTYLGESYANFGIAGIFLVPPILAFFLAFFCRKAYEVPHDSVLRFAYILLSVNLIQVYRDGLVSIVMFTFVNMMPLMIIIIFHLFSAAVRKRRHLGLATFSDTGGARTNP